jgi:F-type H+-transporting ATPase subunit a
VTSVSPDLWAEGFKAPGPADFNFPDVTGGGGWITKPVLLLVLSGIIVFAFFYMTSRRAAVVPSKSQFVGEEAYGYIRNSLAREILGSKDFLPFVPYLVALFFFVLVNNLFGVIPFLQFPSFSRVGFAYALAGLTYVLYNGVGIWKHGFVGYLKLQTVPAGVPKAILPLLIPLEFFSNLLVRPITLSLRLFANMFAGHLLLGLFTLGGEYLLIHAHNVAYKPVGVLTYLLGFAVAFLEILIEVLQAYVFTLLTAMYVQGALAEEH